MMTGRSSETDCSGTPRQISILGILSAAIPLFHLNKLSQNQPTSWVLEVFQRILQHIFLINYRSRVDLHSIEGQLLLLFGQERRPRCTVRQVPEGEDGERESTAARNDEQVPPVCEASRVDLKDTKRKQTFERTSDGGSSVEDSKTSRVRHDDRTWFGSRS
jgi:hypothetical protein